MTWPSGDTIKNSTEIIMLKVRIRVISGWRKEAVIGKGWRGSQEAVTIILTWTYELYVFFFLYFYPIFKIDENWKKAVKHK